MLESALAIAPVFLLICAGFALRRGVLTSGQFWRGADRLVYFALMPALFFARISEADLGAEQLAAYATTLIAGFFAAVVFGIVAALWLRRGGAVGTSLIQGAGRFNTFIALAVAEALHGAPGLQLAVLGAAILVPVVNLTIVGLFVVFVPQKGGRVLGGAAVALLTNPLILSILAAVIANATGLAPIPVLSEALALIGQAALPIMLLCVGASLRLRGLSADAWPTLLAAFGKLAVFPAAILGASALLGLAPLPTAIALVFGAVPTSAAAYALARQLGGDATLMATMITVQTLLAFAAMPLILALGP